jgi:16S rRNA (guanine(966)-N(2))-methyltransferase RsmD
VGNVTDRSLRILAGLRKGKKLNSLPGMMTRPLMRRVKQSLFDIIKDRVPGAYFLDMFAGTGNVGIEAISRGADKVVFVDNDANCIKAITGNLNSCKFQDKAEVIKSDIVLWAVKGAGFYTKIKFGLIFIGPPFKLNLSEYSLNTIDKLRLLDDKGWVICQHYIGEKVPDKLKDSPLAMFRQEKYGKTMLSFYKYE